jgi:adenylate cyclase
MHIGPIRRRDALPALLIALAIGTAAASPAFDRLHGLSVDALTALRWHAFGRSREPRSSPAVVVALDEESYRTPPFRGTPNVTWTREIGRVLTAIVDGGAKVVGFDVVFPTSIEQSEIPFGGETLGERVRGFDRDFLRTLATAARAGKVVLGEIQHRAEPILPAPGQRTAVGQQRNIRPLNVYNDLDDVVRRVTLTFIVDGRSVPSLSVELASRALGSEPELAADGTMVLGGYRIPSLVPNTIALNFEGGADDIPTFSLADLHACIGKDSEFFRRNFDGKVVILGTLLDVEDRKVTSKRYATAPEGAFAERCALPPSPAGTNSPRDTISGVYVQATAVNNLLNRNALTELGRIGTGLLAAAIVSLAAMAALILGPAAATLAYAGLGLAWTAGATFAFKQAVVLPLAEPLLAGIVALAATVGYRFVVTDRDKRALRSTFALYLAPALVEKMMASNEAPALGGETRNVTLFFSDLAGFSTISEKMSPTEVVGLMNEYLSAMTDIIEEHAGFVDKYVGDAIAAVFGAPVDDPYHARNAVLAALRCRGRLEEINRAGRAFGSHQLSQRIGLNSGEALVGNIGSRRRFNYTAMGDAVNLASRLEGANKYFGTFIMASEATVARTGSVFRWRELDAIRVKGRSQPVRIFEPLAEAGQETPEQTSRAAVYAQGLACWRARDFAGAIVHFARIAHADPPAALFLERAKRLDLSPPEPDWEPVNSLEDK